MSTKQFVFADDGVVPNSIFPVVVHHKAFDFDKHEEEPSRIITRRAEKNRWEIRWQHFVYKKPHYHSKMHEVLVVLDGTAILRFGGPIAGREITVSCGDAVVIPAGVMHQAVERSADFIVAGLQQIGSPEYDMCYGLLRERSTAFRRIAKLGPPPKF